MRGTAPALLLCALACTSAPTPGADAGTADAAAGDAGRGDAAPAADALTADAAGGDAAVPTEPWDVAFCARHECYFILQGEPGADDRRCNGRHPIDLGTVDAQGLGDCPFKSFQSTRLRRLMASDDQPNLGRSFFLGAGRYPTWPGGLVLRGDGAGPEEAVRLTNFRGQRAELYGDQCPASCEVTTETGTVSVSPCCAIRCGSCDADPRCLPLGDGCGIPWDKVQTQLTVLGAWARVEGLELSGCFSDDLAIASRSGVELRSVVPNQHLYVANNKIGGCDVNENIKGYRQGPGALQGGPVWGPTHLVGNELYAMASQGIDATGVHAFTIEDNVLHDAKVGSFMGTGYDGGGIGLKNGGSQALVRNNWLSDDGGGLSLGGVSGSCIEDTEAPHGYGCFQIYELTQAVAENNVLLGARGNALQLYQCDGCELRGNLVSEVGGEVVLRISDDCPGPRCPPHNPRLLASRDVVLERNYLSSGPWHREGAYFSIYPGDVHPGGPVVHGMRSRANTFCGPSGVAEERDPQAALALFAHTEPPELFALDGYAAQIGDQGSAVYNAPGASVEACPPPPVCQVGVEADADEAQWSVPGATRCLLAIDGAEREVECAGRRALDGAERAPGRHYLALRADLARGGASCGASYQVESAIIGAGCALSVDGAQLRWSAGGSRCRRTADARLLLAEGPCRGEAPLPAALTSPGRHQVRLAVLDSEAGQTTCSVVYGR